MDDKVEKQAEDKKDPVPQVEPETPKAEKPKQEEIKQKSEAVVPDKQAEEKKKSDEGKPQVSEN